MKSLVVATVLLASAALAADSSTELVSRVIEDHGYVALIVGQGGEAPLLSESYRCVPRTNRFYAREYDDDRQGMAGEIGDEYWTSRGFAQVECDEICRTDAAPFGNTNEWAWRKRVTPASLLRSLNNLTSAQATRGASRQSVAARRQAISAFRRRCGI